MTSRLWSVLHFRPRRVTARLAALVRAGVIDTAPNLWQLGLGIAYMHHRLVFRPQTLGIDASGTVRSTRRARWLRWRAIRLPFLLAKGAVNPLDQTGLGSSDAHVIRHLVGAFHPGDNFHYDLQILAVSPGTLSKLRGRVRAIVDGTAADAELLRDLATYEGYHQRLLEAVDRWLTDPPTLPHHNPDTTLPAFLTWCARQPSHPAATLRAAWHGRLSFAPAVPA